MPTSQLRQSGQPDWSALDWGDGVHHVNFTLTDGDNVQWIMGNFIGGAEAHYYYGNPNRGHFPFTWGLPVPSLCQLSPRTLAEILAKATPNDDFIQFNGDGYFYPDFYGKARCTGHALELQAERLRAYMDMTDIRILAFNFQNWNGADARSACELFASRLPGLLGIFAFQYYPYSAGNGSIRWVQGIGADEVPVVSCRLCIWAKTGRPHDTTPSGVAAQLNRLPGARGQASDDAFSWVLAHAWSRFRRADTRTSPDAEETGVEQDKDSTDTERGYNPVLWAVERLGPLIKPVSAREMLLRVRMRLRPQAMLTRCLDEVAAQESLKASRQSEPKLAEVRALLPKAGSDAPAARRCFEILKSLKQS